MRFNINHTVKVRLTDKGRETHHVNHVWLFRNWKEPPEYVRPKEDEGGWSEWQLWDLMKEFGPGLYNGCNIPFETEIEIGLSSTTPAEKP